MDGRREIPIRMWRLQGSGPSGMFLYFNPETEGVRLYSIPQDEVEEVDDPNFMSSDVRGMEYDCSHGSVSALGAGGRATHRYLKEPSYFEEELDSLLEVREDG